ncbi:MAG: porin [Pseudomonadota bacterium]
MKKSLIALAVAGVVSAPAFAATSNVDVYGQLRMSVDRLSVDGDDNDGWQMTDRVSRIGFKGSEDLGGGLKALWQIESQMSIDGGTIDSGLRNTFIGLAGGFGTVVLGRHDTPYKMVGSADLFGDTAADAQCSAGGVATSQCIIGRNAFDNRAANTLAYISPDFSGFQVAAAIVPGEEMGGTTASNDANGLMDAYSLSATYKNGPLNAGLGYERFDGDMASAVTTGLEDRDAWKFNIGYAFGDLKVGYTYERSDNASVATGQEQDSGHLLSAAYGMGPITLAAQYGRFSDDTSGFDDVKRWTVGAIYSLSKRTNVYAAYHDGNANNAAGTDIDVWTFGMNHSF